MAGRIMELAIAIKGRLDGSVTSSMQKAVSESRKLQKQLTQANRAMQEAQKAASAEQKATGHVSAAQYEHIAFLQGKINALTQRRSDILDAQAKKENAGNKFSAATGNLAKGAAAVAAGAAPLAAMIGTAATFEQAMSKVKAITNSSNEDMARLNETAQQLGASTQFSATQAAEAMSYLGMAGWKTDQIIAGMPGMLDLAAASGSDLATVADIVSDDLTAFGMSADQAGHMADVMAAASTNANTNVEMMGMTFKYAGAVAGALGYSLEDVSIATGLMANAGIKADQAGTSLRAIMTRLIDPPKDAATALDALGISAVNADGSVKPFRQTIMELREKFKDLSQSEKAQMASSIAGTEAMSGFLAVVNASDSDFDTLANAIDNADGASKKMADTMNDNAKGGAIQLESAIEGVSIAIGSIFLPTLAKIAGAVATAVGAVANWAKENQTLVGVIITTTAALAALVMTVLTINAAAAGISYLSASFALYRTVVSDANIVTRLWAGATRVAAAAQAALNAVMSANPIAIAVLAVIALVSALIYLFNTNQSFHDAVIDLWNGICNAATSAWTAIREAAMPVIEAICTALEPIGTAAASAWETAKGIMTGAWNALMAGAARVSAAAGPAFRAVFGAVSSTVGSIASGIGGAVASAMRAISSIVQAVLPYLLTAWQAVTPVLSAVWNVIVTAATVAFDVLSTAIMAIVGSGGVIEHAFSGIINVIVTIFNAITGVFSGEISVWQAILMVFEAYFDAVWNLIVAIAVGAWEVITTAAEGAWNLILSIINVAAAAIGVVMQAVAAIVGAVWNAILSVAQAVWTSIVAVIQANAAYINAIWHGILAVANGVWFAIKAVIVVVAMVITSIMWGVANAIMAIWLAIGPTVAAVWQGICSAVSSAIRIITGIVENMAMLLSTVWNGIVQAAQFVWNGLVMIVQGVMSAISFIIQGAVTVITAYWTFIAPIYIAVWDAIGSAVSMVISTIVSIVSTAGAMVMAVWDAICAAAMAVWSAICAVVTMVVSVIMGIVDAAAAMIMAAWDAIYQTAVSAWEAIVGVVQGVIDAVVSAVDEGVGWVEDKWNHLREIFSAPIQAVVNFVKTGSSEAESVAEEQAGESAAGGVFTHPYLTWVAEAGYPEVIVPTRKSARAVSLWQTAGRMLGLVPDGVKAEPMSETKATPQPIAMPTLRESAGTPSVKVSFAPTVNISGQADAGVAEMIRAALAEQKRQFEKELPDMLRRARANERRLSYA